MVVACGRHMVSRGDAPRSIAHARIAVTTAIGVRNAPRRRRRGWPADHLRARAIREQALVIGTLDRDVPALGRESGELGLHTTHTKRMITMIATITT
jgi:hypothetical protein